MMYAYDFTLCRRAVIITMDLSASNLHLFDVDHWLSDKKNCLLLRLDAPAWQDPGLPPSSALDGRAAMAAWSVSDLAAWLSSRDLAGPAGQLRQQGVAGEDFVSATIDGLVKDVGLSPFTARKLVRLRDGF